MIECISCFVPRMIDCDPCFLMTIHLNRMEMRRSLNEKKKKKTPLVPTAVMKKNKLSIQNYEQKMKTEEKSHTKIKYIDSFSMFCCNYAHFIELLNIYISLSQRWCVHEFKEAARICFFFWLFCKGLQSLSLKCVPKRKEPTNCSTFIL